MNRRSFLAALGLAPAAALPIVAADRRVKIRTANVNLPHERAAIDLALREALAAYEARLPAAIHDARRRRLI